MKKIFSYLFVLTLIVTFMSACSSSDEKTTRDDSKLKYLNDFQVRADAGMDQVTLDWQMDPKAETYNIRYIEDDGTGNRPDYTIMKAVTPITGVLSAPYTVSGLRSNAAYWFSVSGVNPKDESYLWLPVKSVTTSALLPRAPEDVRPNPGNAKITLTWTPVSATPTVTSYKIYCYWQEGLDAGIAETITVEGQASRTKTLDTIHWKAGSDHGTPLAGTTTGLKNGRTYVLYVTAISDAGESSPSFAVYVTPSENPPPVAPVFLTAQTGSTSSTQILLQWTEVAGVGNVSYNIYYGKAKGVTKGTGIKVVAGDTNQGYMTSLTKNMKYYFVITAKDDNGESSESNELSVTPTVD
jgi:hypothetical protein